MMNIVVWIIIAVHMFQFQPVCIILLAFTRGLIITITTITTATIMAIIMGITGTGMVAITATATMATEGHMVAMEIVGIARASGRMMKREFSVD
jgi:hypothetical protein